MDAETFQLPLVLALHKAHRAVARQLDIALRPVGITGDQFMVLASISRLANPCAADLALELVKDHSTISANLKLLSAKGLVNFSARSGDSRSRILSLNGQGMESLRAAWSLVEGIENKVVAIVGGSPVRLLRDLAALAERSKAQDDGIQQGL